MINHTKSMINFFHDYFHNYYHNYYHDYYYHNYYYHDYYHDYYHTYLMKNGMRRRGNESGSFKGEGGTWMMHLITRIKPYCRGYTRLHAQYFNA